MKPIINMNDILRDTFNETTYRVLWVSPNMQYGYWISMDGNNGMPSLFQYGDLRESVISGELVREEETEVQDASHASEKAIIQRDRIWSIFQKALESEPDIYERDKRADLLREVSAKSGIRLPNCYAYLSKYWKRGKTPNAFLPDYSKVGKCRDYRKRDYPKLGRPSQSAGGFGKSLQEGDFRNFQKAIQKYYLTRNEATLRETYTRMLGDFYAVQQERNGESVLKLLPPEKIPSFAQFRYWYYKNRDVSIETKKRKGESKYELNARGITGRSDYQLMGPGSKYQIDATVGDVYLVSQFDRDNIIGRPVMYFVIDAFSRMVTGMYVGLEGPSWAGAMMAIENAATDKVPYCAGFGIEIQDEDWPCRHIPTAILGDRGEMESRAADNLVSMLGIRIENTPPYRADLKGIIEQNFRTINTNATVFLPGRVKPDMAERGGKDYRLDAKLDIRQFTSIVIRCVLYYNNSHYMDYFEKSGQMMAADVKPIPRDIWNFGIQYCSGSLRSVSREKIRLALMPTDKGRVTERGVRFKGLFYSSETASRELWFAKARNWGRYPVVVSYDPRDMSAIYVQDSGVWVRCELVDWEKKYAGKQLNEVIYEQEREKQVRQQQKIRETEAKINLNRQIDAVIAEADSIAERGKRTKAERLRGIRENRKREKEAIRESESFMKGGEASEENAAPKDNEEEMSPVLKMIQRKVEERIKDDPLFSQGGISGADDSGIQGQSSD